MIDPMDAGGDREHYALGAATLHVPLPWTGPPRQSGGRARESGIGPRHGGWGGRATPNGQAGAR